MTNGYRLPAKHVIHTVGPVWHGGSRGEKDVLASCYTSALRLAAEAGLHSIAFPCISTGIYGYPAELAAKVAVEASGIFFPGKNLGWTCCSSASHLPILLLITSCLRQAADA
jgi:O-acetyl-ADP-ribose deacetylase (regulator of RNase III)